MRRLDWTAVTCTQYLIIISLFSHHPIVPWTTIHMSCTGVWHSAAAIAAIPGQIVDGLDFLTRRHPLALLLQKTRLPKQTCRCTLSSYQITVPGVRGQSSTHSFFCFFFNASKPCYFPSFIRLDPQVTVDED